MDTRAINIDPKILGGTPASYGSRIHVKDFFTTWERVIFFEIFLESFDGVS